jgi:hypothetical protein
VVRRTLPVLVVALALVATTVAAAPLPPDAVPPEIATPALSYANSLARGNPAHAWDLLSSESRAGITAAQWRAAFQRRPTVLKPPASALLRALATQGGEALVGDVLAGPDEALVEVRGSVKVPMHVVLVRESAGWRVDLAASDRLNSRAAVQTFLEVLRDEARAAQPRRMPQAIPDANIPLLRAVLASEVREYQILGAEIEGNRAQVALQAAVPVNLVLRTHRVGPGWMVDFSRPLVPVDTTSQDPLQEAAAAADRMACEENLRQLARAVLMYASASGDRLPDPDRWLQQIRPHLPRSAGLHCPGDPTPGISYAMNRNLAGRRTQNISNRNRAATVLLFESTLHTANPADTGQSWADPPRHPGGNLVAYLDGSVRLAAARPDFTIARQPAATGRGGTAVRPRTQPRVRPPASAP